MKKLLVFLCLVVSVLGYSQEIYQPLIDRYNTVDYIFEGKVIETHPYLTADGKTIYTSNVIEISKIFKGNLSCGTIEMITDGGIVGDLSMSGSHSLTPAVGEIGIFLTTANIKELPAQSVYAFTNTNKIGPTYEWQSFIKYQFENSAWSAYDLWQKFNDLNQLYNFTELVTGLQYIDCNSQMLVPPHQSTPAPKPYHPDSMPIYSRAEYNRLLNTLTPNVQNPRRVHNSRSNYTLQYSLANLTITGSNPNYLEFDLMLSDNSGLLFLNSAGARIYYDTSVFGDSVVANGKIQVSRGPLISSVTDYDNPTPGDDVSGMFIVPISSLPYTAGKVHVSTTPAVAAHIKMQMTNCGATSFVGFSDFQETPLFTFMSFASAYGTSANDSFPITYDAYDTTGPQRLPRCVATINNFDPDTITGGTGSIFNIHGIFFGAAQGNGRLYMKNADNGGLSYLTLQDSDIVVWSDTLIQVRVPSIDSASAQKTIGSGKFIIENSSHEKDTSNTALTVFYAIGNHARSNSDPTKIPVTLISQLGTGGYRFYVDTSISHNPDAYGCIKKAIHEWVCATGVNFTLVGDTFGIYTNRSLIDSINLITFSDTIHGIGAKTFANYQRCTLPTQVLPIIDIDMLINPHYMGTYWYDSSGTQTMPPNMIDFYKVVLHEFGHALGLQHVIDPSAIMFYLQQVVATPVLPAARIVNIRVDESAIAGGNYSVDQSINPVLNYNCIAGPMVERPVCIGYNSIRNIRNDGTGVSVYPNPFNHYLTIYTESNRASRSIGAELYSMDGRIVKEWILDPAKLESKIELPLSLASGLYMLNIITDRGNVVKKLIHAED